MNTKLHEAFEAIQALPEETQEAIAFELLEELPYYTESSLSPEQVAIVQERLSRPFEYASNEEVSRVLDKHNLHVPKVA
jgi:hypothetical protein